MFFQKNTKKSVFAESIQTISSQYINRKPIQHVIILLSLVLFSVLLAKPYIEHTEGTVSVSPNDIVLVLDVSKSMQADDFDPDRLSVAKVLVSEFLDTLGTERVGLVVFAGKAFSWLPLTRDYEFVKETVQGISTDTINQNIRSLQGTATGEGLLTAIEVFEKQSKYEQTKQKNIILLTDGEVTLGTINPVLVSKLAKEKDIKIYGIGIGSEEGGSFLYEGFGGTQMVQVPGIDDEGLREIASGTDAQYRRATNEEIFAKIFDEISSTTLKNVEEKIQGETAFYWRPFVGVLVVALSLLFRLSGVSFSSSVSLTIGASILLLLFSSLGIFPRVESDANSGDASRYDVMFMLDVSKSMDVEDMVVAGRTVSRLDFAKWHMRNLVLKYPGWRFGLGVFAGSAVGVLPLSTDHDHFLGFLESVEDQYAGLMQPGTSIDGAIQRGVERFVENKSGITLIYSDGGEGELPDDLPLRESGVLPVLIGIGTQTGGPIPLPDSLFGSERYLQYDGETVLSKVNTQGLSALSEYLGTSYVSADQKLDLLGLVDTYKIEKNDSASIKLPEQSKFSRWLIVAGGVLFLTSLLFRGIAEYENN